MSIVYRRYTANAVTSRLFKGFTWNLLGNLVSKGAIFVTSILAANLLGPENFGRIGVVQQTVGMMITFSVMGLSQTAILFVGRSITSSASLQKAIVNRINVIGVMSSVTICTVYFALSGYIASEVFGDAELTYLLKICALVLIGNTLNQIQFGVLSGLGKFNKIAFTNISVGVVSIPITYLLMSRLGVEGFIWALVVNCWLTFMLNKFFINRLVEASCGGAATGVPTYREIIAYASSNVIGALLFASASWYALGVLTRNSGLVDVAAFNASMQVFSILYLVPTMLAQVLMSMTSRQGLNTLTLRRIIFSTAVIITAVSFAVSAFSSEILALYGAELIRYVSVLNWVLAVVVVASVINLLDHYANGAGLMKVRIVSHVVFFVCYVSLASFFVRDASDLAAAMFLAYLIRAVALYLLLHSKLGWFR